ACLEVWPGSPSTHLLAARTARRAGRLDEAVDHLYTGEKLGASAEAVALEWDLLRAQRGDLADVEKRLRACLRQDHPDRFLILEVLTWQMIKEHRLPEAQALLDRWLKDRPDDREALVRYGWVREHLFDFEGAIRAYRRALDLDPARDQAEKDRVRL